MKPSHLSYHFWVEISDLSPKKHIEKTFGPALLVSAATAAGGLAFLYAKVFAKTTDFSSQVFEQLGWWAVVPSGILQIVAFLIVEIGAPPSAGSGIPQVMALVRADSPSRFFFHTLAGGRVLVSKILSSLVSLFGGAAIGREGPMIQIGASVFYLAKRIARKIRPNFEIPYDNKALIMTGGAAGLAAAFNTPLGGVVFAIEELSNKTFHEFKTEAVLAVVIAGIAAQTLAGPYLYLGYHPVSIAKTFSFYFFILLLATIGGIAGGLFGQLLFGVTKVRKRLLKLRWQKILCAFLVGVVIGSLGILTHSQSLGPGIDRVQGLFARDQTSDLSMIFIRFIGPIISYSAGAAGGIFAPSLSVGAHLGSWFAHNTLMSDSGDLFVILGMVAFMSGMSHAPLTSFVLLLEMTDASKGVLPMLLTSAVAFLATKIVSKQSFYSKSAETWSEQELRKSNNLRPS